MIAPRELRAMQALAQQVWRLFPERVDMTVGELAYQAALANADPSDESIQHLWTNGATALAWAWLWRPATLEWQVHPDRPELLDEVLDWFEDNASRAGRLETSARRADVEAIDRIARRGFEHDHAAPWSRLNIRELEVIDEPRLPAGYRFRTLTDYGGDVAPRVAVHRASWAEFGTRVTQETYASIMSTWPYRSDLDFVVEAPDRTPVAFALGWYDDANRVAEFEPVGTDPRFRRLGLGRAVNLFGLRRFREAGATHAIVACRGDDAHPIPLRLYQSVGFRELSRQHRFVRRG